ncbi:hypothetical protein FPOAC2_07519 [Fusarium poae]
MTSASLFQSILPFWSNSYRSKKSRFKYSRLLTLEIRLLELQPGLPEDPLAGTILQRELAPGNRKIPDYEALSYCWGDQSHPQTISLAAEHHSHGAHSKTPTKSQCLEIGPNLASALKSLRYHDRSRILWCDSICINQRNLAERSSQVQRMGDVYRWAKRVVIWLGPETSWSRTIMEALRGLANQVPQTIDITRDWHRIGQVLGVNRTGPIPTTHDQLLAYEQLLDIDWHRRLWTFQEIAFANQETSIVRFGGEEMLWNMYKNSVMFMSLQVDNVSPACVKNVQVFTAKFMAGNMFGMGDSHEWVGFLHLTNRYECTDIRDRLYAIRGFLRTDVAQSIRVDYRKSAKQILASACVSHINRNGTLQFLELCNSDTKPTWTADLGKQLHTLSLTSSASGKSAASAVLVKSGVLEVAGVSCDEICSTPIVLPYKRFDQPEEEYMLLLIQFLQCLTGNEDFYNDDECLNELINMLKFGLLWDHDIAFTKSRPEGALISLESGRNFIRQFITHNEVQQGFVNLLVDIMKLRACTRTRNGTFARVPTESRPGDIIVTLLGLQCNLVLRRQRRKGYYKVIGPCYHPAMSHGQALLGDNFDGWKRLWCITIQAIVFWKEGRRVRLSDPRLDGVRLPKGYTRTRFPVGNDGEEGQIWVHRGSLTNPTEKDLIYDPRLSEPELKRRGVPVQRFRLI